MKRSSMRSAKRAPRLLAAGLVVLLAPACAPSTKEEPAQAIPTGDNSRTSLDWAGTYGGLVPCADCVGIDTRLTLASDGRYRLRLRYQGRSDSAFVTAGEFTWDSAGRSITLGGITDGADRYQVMEGALLQLDRQGDRITGELADRYRLARLEQPREGPVAKLVTTRWALVAVRGRSLATRAENARAPYLEFDYMEERVSGTGGCNRLSGAFTLSEGNRIRIAPQMASTMMACADMTGDQALAELLPMADNFAILGDTLTLNRARMAPLLTFVAAPGT